MFKQLRWAGGNHKNRKPNIEGIEKNAWGSTQMVACPVTNLSKWNLSPRKRKPMSLHRGTVWGVHRPNIKLYLPAMLVWKARPTKPKQPHLFLRLLKHLKHNLFHYFHSCSFNQPQSVSPRCPLRSVLLYMRLDSNLTGTGSAGNLLCICEQRAIEVMKRFGHFQILSPI